MCIFCLALLPSQTLALDGEEIHHGAHTRWEKPIARLNGRNVITAGAIEPPIWLHLPANALMESARPLGQLDELPAVVARAFALFRDDQIRFGGNHQPVARIPDIYRLPVSVEPNFSG